MRYLLMLMACVLMTVGCNEATDEQTTLPGDSTGKPIVSGADRDHGETADASAAKPVDVPEDWPEYVPVYPGSVVLDSNWQENPENPEEKGFSAELECSDEMDVVYEYFQEQLLAAEMRQIDEVISPEQVGGSFQKHPLIVSVGVMVAEENTAIMVNAMSVAEMRDFPSSITWYEMDDVPPGFPSDLLKRYPGATIVGARVTGDIMSNMELTTTDSDADVFSFYDAYLVDLGWSVQDSSEEDFGKVVNYTKGEASIGVTATTDEEGTTNASLFYQSQDMEKLMREMMTEESEEEVTSVDSL